LHPAEAENEKTQLLETVANEEIDLVAAEKEKIKGAIRTDFILSAEIIVISLGTIAAATFSVKVATLIAISLIMTIGVYGLVAGIVKLDDAGLHLTSSRRDNTRDRLYRSLGTAILWFAPVLMKFLSIVGTAAMFIVGGGILTHGFHWISERIASTASLVANLPGIGDLMASLTTMLLDSVVGLIAGAAVLAIVTLVQRMRSKPSDSSEAH